MTREEAIKELRELRKIGEIMTNAHYEAVDTAIKALEQEPKTDNRVETELNGVKTELAQEPKTGHWIMHIDDLFPVESTMECSECGNHQPLTIDDNYCPNCGAKMESEG